MKTDFSRWLKAPGMNEFANMKFRKPRTDAQLSNITEVRTGLLHKPHKKHVWKEGHSVETKKKISEALKGHKLSDETRQKLSAARKGKPLSEHTKLKISETRKMRSTEK
ncbi:MAG TPA: NUMOD3 domain-containing DNA-binding protein [Chitinophagaceae bacterium]|nr:NUMOD3 domain-containing DNA-binding protein [Chitinophagaceae bacterium]